MAVAWGVAGLALPGVLVMGAWLPHGIAGGSSDRGEVLVVHAQLRRVLLAELEENEGAARADFSSLTVASLGDARVLAGVAQSPMGEELKVGFVLLLGGSETVPDGVYEVRGPTSAVAVDLVDSAGKVVATIPLDLPFSDGGTSANVERWQRVLLTVARWLAPRLR